MASQQENLGMASTLDGAVGAEHAVGAAGSEFSDTKNLTSDNDSNIEGPLANLFNVSHNDDRVDGDNTESFDARIPIMVARSKVVSPGGNRRRAGTSLSPPRQRSSPPSVGRSPPTHGRPGSARSKRTLPEKPQASEPVIGQAMPEFAKMQ